MDAIPSGITSVTPIIPETATIGDRSGLHSPPVEIAPLPGDSFKGDGAAAELLNNPFTLDLNGQDQGEAVGGGRAPGRAASGGAAAGGAATEPPLGEAYTLSLGTSEEEPMPQEIARELNRVKNYEKLGKAAARQSFRRNPAAGSAGQNTAGTDEGTTIEFIGDRLQSLAARSATGYGAPLQADGTGNDPVQAAVVQTDTPPQAGTMALRLTLSDYETLLTLEPDLQDALLRLLSENESAAGLGGQAEEAGTPNGQRSLNGNGAAAGMPGDAAPDAAAGAPASNTFSGVMAELLGRARPQSITGKRDPAPGTMTAAPGAAGDIVTAEGTTARLASPATAPAAVRSAEAGMENLKKIRELPYALYLFGNDGYGKRAQAEEEEDPVLNREKGSGRARAPEFLRLSEAVRMAAVLHNIYRGGTGSFPQETPWYAPYMQYAARHGIIRGGDFDDWGDFATRAEMAYIFSGSVPKAEFPVLNYAPALTDVDEDAGYGAYIYLLSRAGVLPGGDKNGRFYPESMITRTEAAAVIGRIATPSDRKRF